MESHNSQRDASTMLGVRINGIPLDEATSQALAIINSGRDKLTFACANPHSLVEAQKDHVFNEALNETDLVVADGAGVILASRLSGIRVGPRIAGSDYFFSIMRALHARGHGRVFFFGSSDHVLGCIAQRIRGEFPDVELCGMISPPFGDWSDAENKAMIQVINEADPDVLWVGMTAPKQEKWVYANKNNLNARVIGSIGAVFDFYAGTHPRAPEWMCRVGIEWLYRLIREPRRMWKRNFISTPKFLYLVLVKHILNRAA